eukprot:TRINITY_DN10845_c0_g1_i1.p1 TRINITY_DN10845_c0_g1~~TRINITY_DN10845_c0_g1_i1.p1  ORF type:complete len:185 (-),score=35.88 TRINITY_DN10845_c0_g1_i1:76-630(-)
MTTITELVIDGAYLIEGKKFQDARGWFQESYRKGNYKHLEMPFEQISCSESKKNVIRGIHCSPYAKIVSCIKGKVWDVVIDFRPKSPSYLKWQATELSETKQLYVPPRCGHAFFSLEDESIVIYFQGGVFQPSLEMDVNLFDKEINIDWPKPSTGEYIISEKDKASPVLKEAQRMWEERNQVSS